MILSRAKREALYKRFGAIESSDRNDLGKLQEGLAVLDDLITSVIDLHRGKADLDGLLFVELKLFMEMYMEALAHPIGMIMRQRLDEFIYSREPLIRAYHKVDNRLSAIWERTAGKYYRDLVPAGGFPKIESGEALISGPNRFSVEEKISLTPAQIEIVGLWLLQHQSGWGINWGRHPRTRLSFKLQHTDGSTSKLNLFYDSQKCWNQMVYMCRTMKSNNFRGCSRPWGYHSTTRNLQSLVDLIPISQVASKASGFGR